MGSKLTNLYSPSQRPFYSLLISTAGQLIPFLLNRSCSSEWARSCGRGIQRRFFCFITRGNYNMFNLVSPLKIKLIPWFWLNTWIYIWNFPLRRGPCAAATILFLTSSNMLPGRNFGRRECWRPALGYVGKTGRPTDKPTWASFQCECKDRCNNTNISQDGEEKRGGWEEVKNDCQADLLCQDRGEEVQDQVQGDHLEVWGHDAAHLVQVEGQHIQDTLQRTRLIPHCLLCSQHPLQVRGFPSHLFEKGPGIESIFKGNIIRNFTVGTPYKKGKNILWIPRLIAIFLFPQVFPEIPPNSQTELWAYLHLCLKVWQPYTSHLPHWVLRLAGGNQVVGRVPGTPLARQDCI